jgi:hypothetical protein
MFQTDVITLERNGQCTQVQMKYTDFRLYLHGPTQTVPV